MTIVKRTLLVIAMMTFALAATVIDSVEHGWTVLGTIGAACFVLVIAAELVILARARPHV